MKKGVIIGRLGQDPRVRQTHSGEAVLNLNVAVRDRKKQDGAWVEGTQWWDVTLFGKRAEALANLLSKGQMIAADGDIGLREYTARDGSHKAQLELIARDIEPLSPSQKTEGDARPHGTRPGTFARDQGAPAGRAQHRDQLGPQGGRGAPAGFGNYGDPDDDIPF